MYINLPTTTTYLPSPPQPRCPHCGYCPHCGHVSPNPFTPHWAPNTGTVTITRGQLGGATSGFNGGQISDNVQRS